MVIWGGTTRIPDLEGKNKRSSRLCFIRWDLCSQGPWICFTRLEVQIIKSFKFPEIGECNYSSKHPKHYDEKKNNVTQVCDVILPILRPLDKATWCQIHLEFEAPMNIHETCKKTHHSPLSVVGFKEKQKFKYIRSIEPNTTQKIQHKEHTLKKNLWPQTTATSLIPVIRRCLWRIKATRITAQYHEIDNHRYKSVNNQYENFTISNQDTQYI